MMQEPGERFEQRGDWLKWDPAACCGEKRLWLEHKGPRWEVGSPGRARTGWQQGAGQRTRFDTL